MTVGGKSVWNDFLSHWVHLSCCKSFLSNCDSQSEDPLRLPEPGSRPVCQSRNREQFVFLPTSWFLSVEDDSPWFRELTAAEWSWPQWRSWEAWEVLGSWQDLPLFHTRQWRISIPHHEQSQQRPFLMIVGLTNCFPNHLQVHSNDSNDFSLHQSKTIFNPNLITGDADEH